ncbi:MAG: hypothetical protein ACXABC_16065 [Candidatus Thorarchaeota archaeon]|jgi:hypothetical protein
MSAPLEDLLRDAKVEIVVARAEKDPSVIKELIESLNSDVRSIRFNASLEIVWMMMIGAFVVRLQDH